MQINNIALSTQKCNKPYRSTSFKGLEGSNGQKKVRYKHYEELSDDMLMARSIVKAHQDSKDSMKMRLYKSLPSIATGIIATSLAITRPGKLSGKTAEGLGFLALSAGVDAAVKLASKRSDDETKKDSFKTLAILGAAAAGAVAVKNGKGADGFIGKTVKFLQKEGSKLASEINSSKLADLSDKYIEPFIQKHPKLSFVAPFVTAISTSVIGSVASFGLLKGISKDISENACKNYEKGKMIQYLAREHFDSVNAVEV